MVTYEEWRSKILSRRHIMIQPWNEVFGGPKYLFIKVWRLNMILRPFYIRIAWLSDSTLREAWDNPGTIFKGWELKL